MIGTLGSAVLGIGAYLLMPHYGSDHRVKGDYGYSPNANTAFSIASYVGAVSGVFHAGRSRDQTGTLTATAIGASLVAMPILISGRSGPVLPYAFLAVPLQAIGATVGFQRSRRVSESSSDR